MGAAMMDPPPEIRVRARVKGFLFELPAWRFGRRPGFGFYPLDEGEIAAVRLELDTAGTRSMHWATREEPE